MNIPDALNKPAWRRFFAGIAVATLIWALGAGVVAPMVVRVSPAGAFASLMIAWHESLRDGVLILLAFGLVVPGFAALGARRVRVWVEPATPAALGAIRVWIAAILLASALWEDLPSSAALPRGMLDIDRNWLIGLLRSLPIGFERFLADADALRLFEAVTIVLLLLAMVGLFTRWTVPAAAVAYLMFASILRAYAWSYHTGLIPLYALLLLSFTPCSDALSLDRWRRERRGEEVPPARTPQLAYGLARYIVWMAIALPYTLAGLSKLRNTGILWWRGEHLEQLLMTAVVEPMHFDFQLVYLMLRGPSWFFDVLGLAALVTEVTFALVLVSRVARIILPVAMAGTHLGILLLQNILFPDLIAVQAVFYDWSKLGDRLPRLHSGTMREVRAPAARTIERLSWVARGFLILAFTAWTTRTEKFPLTAMQMFSRPLASRPVEYVRPFVIYEDGSTEPARFERWIGAVADSRYRALLRKWESDARRIPLLTEFLAAVAERANADAQPGSRIAGFRFEARRWDFRKAPDDPQRGRLEYELRYDVATGRMVPVQGSTAERLVPGR